MSVARSRLKLVLSDIVAAVHGRLNAARNTQLLVEALDAYVDERAGRERVAEDWCGATAALLRRCDAHARSFGTGWSVVAIDGAVLEDDPHGNGVPVLIRMKHLGGAEVTLRNVRNIRHAIARVAQPLLRLGDGPEVWP